MLPRTKRINILGPMDDDLAAALHEKVRLPFTMDWTSDPHSVLIRAAAARRRAERRGAAQAPVRHARSTCSCCWLVGTAAAAVRHRRAVHAQPGARDPPPRRAPPRRSAWAATSAPIRPEGATEVRQAATAFNRMQERIRRFLVQRTEMLAGVSHDLRTPLTRLRLALAMMPPHEELRQDVAEMTADVEEMERMIGGYLAFARGEGTEQAEAGQPVRGAGGGRRRRPPRRRRRWRWTRRRALTLSLRADAVRRAITNLVDNARRHAHRVALAAMPQGRIGVRDGGRRRPRHPARPARERVPAVRKRRRRRHRPGPDDRARHRPRAWRRDRAGGQSAGRTARADPVAGLSPIAAAGAASRTTSSATRIPRHPRRGDGPGSSGGPRIRDADEGPTSPSPPAPSFRPSLRRIACSTGPTLRHWIAGSGR